MYMMLILVFALVGFLVSFYIYYKKHKKREKMICYIGDDCDKVIGSRFNKFLGIHLEFWGMAYYGLVSILAGLTILGVREITGFEIQSVLFVFGVVAAGVSLILVFIQAFVLREWCEYCLVSALMSILIFATEYIFIL